MSSPRIPLWLALLVALTAPACAQVSGLPFLLDDPDAHWRLVPSDRKLAEGFEMVAAIASPAGAIRMVVFKSPGAKKAAEPLATVAERLRKIVLREPTANLRSAPAKRIGYAGQLVSVDAPRANGTSRCEVFVFPYGDDYWGLLQVMPPDATDASLFASLKKATPAPAGAVALAPFRVHEDPVTSFPLGLRVTRRNDVDRIDRIFVTTVPEGSLTERLGVKVGDEVLSLDGRAVGTFPGGLSQRGELGKLLLDRSPGSTLELELISPGEPKSRTVTLVAGALSGLTRPW